jgi:hypothetical protein
VVCSTCDEQSGGLHVALTSGPLCTSPESADSSGLTTWLTPRYIITMGNLSKNALLWQYMNKSSPFYALLAFLKKWARIKNGINASVFWVITRCMVAWIRRLGTTYRSCLRKKS